MRAFAHQARTAHEHLRKGRGVAVVGRVCSRKLGEGAEGDPPVIEEKVDYPQRCVESVS